MALTNLDVFGICVRYPSVFLIFRKSFGARFSHDTTFYDTTGYAFGMLLTCFGMFSKYLWGPMFPRISPRYFSNVCLVATMLAQDVWANEAKRGRGWDTASEWGGEREREAGEGQGSAGEDRRRTG